MLKDRVTRAVTTSAAIIGLLSGAAHAQAQHRLEISLETSPNHVRNISVVAIAEEMQKRSGGKLEVKVFHGAAKYKDTDVPKALNQGALDMGIPVTFHLGKYVSDFDAVDLPIFYGRSRQEIYKVTDGPIGAALAKKLETKLGVKIIGKWMDLGHQTTYTLAKPINVWTDLKLLKIRTPGGAGNIARFHVLGANPIKIAWPDVPQALQRGTMDGLMTTFESVRSAKLWDSGLKHAYVDNQSYTQYVPMISQKSWSKYPKDIQDLIVKVWAEKIDGARELSESRQNSARQDAKKNGMTVVVPPKADLDSARKLLLSKQDDLVKELKIDPSIVKQIVATLGH
ncbi:MAG: TRAP transporter substrate-binding protein DctP [Hyphomicrobiaceae bacterium]